jgi:hypothetical protein
MCETKIEKAAKAAGASYADWNKDTKVITVKYSSTSSNLAKIQKSIADAGYDNVGVKTTTEAYDKLHDCCKYDRTAVSATNSEKMDCCKKDGTAKMDCCKDGKCTKEGHDGKDCCKNEKEEKH